MRKCVTMFIRAYAEPNECSPSRHTVSLRPILISSHLHPVLASGLFLSVKETVNYPCFLTEHHTIMLYWGSGGIAPCSLDLGIKWRLVVSFKLRPLYLQGKSLCYPLDTSLGGPQSLSGRGGEEQTSLQFSE
jgi:hypothetical protein